MTINSLGFTQSNTLSNAPSKYPSKYPATSCASRWRKSIALLVMVTNLVLTGCQSLKTPTIQSGMPLPTPTSSDSRQFTISGKIGVYTPQQKGSAFYAWTQRGDYFAINLSGALGLGQTTIEGKPGDVTLTSSKTDTIQAATAEELLLKATGWQAPISHLVYWINGNSSDSNAHISRDDQHRIISISEDGWQAQLSYEGQATVPNRLNISDDSNQNRVTLVIQNRQ